MSVHSEPRSGRWKHFRGAWLIAAWLVWLPSAAQARVEHLRWQHPDASTVSAFLVYNASQAGGSASPTSVGVPTPDAGGVYHYDLQVPDSQDAFVSLSAVGTNGLESTRSNESFRPALPPDPDPTPDTTRPTVSLTAPAAGEVAGSVTLQASASDNVGVVGVQFLVNGSAVGAEDTTSPFRVTWNSASVADGSYTLSARARDAAGNQRTSAGVTVTVANTPDPGPDPTPDPDPLPLPDPGEVSLYRINVGGPAFTDVIGRRWEQDLAFVSNCACSLPDSDGRPVRNSLVPELYRRERTDWNVGEVMTYQLPVVDGLYLVRLHFAETGSYGSDPAPGGRLFDVSAEGVRVLRDFDIVSEAGGLDLAWIETLEVEVTDGALTLGLHNTGKGEPRISAIEVVEGEAPPPPPIAPPAAPSIVIP